jgi:hypothetical protein
MSGKELLESEAVFIYKKVLDHERGELKLFGLLSLQIM